jgi:transcriptional regulator
MDATNVLPGTLDLLILKALSLGPLYGYGILLRIEEISGKAFEIEQGAMYPALYRLERRGWIETELGQAENNRRTKYYKLTPAGRKQLRDETDNWHRIVSAMAAALGARTSEV